MSAVGADRVLTPPSQCDVVVVGGGIAGLAAAWQLRAHDVVLLEAENRIGGRIRSEPRASYWLNLAAHVFPPPDSNLGRLVGEVGLETAAIPGASMAIFLNGRIVVGGRPETYPARVRTTVGGRLSFAAAGLKIRRAVREYLSVGRPAPGETPAAVRQRLLAYRDDRTFADFLGPMHPDVDALLRAAVNRVSAEPEALAAGAGVAQFAATFSGAASLFQRNLPGGSSLLTERLHARLGGRVYTAAPVTSVANSADGVDVRLLHDRQEHVIHATAAVVATPAFVARRIVRELDSAHAAALDAVRYGPYVVAAMLTNEQRPMPWDDIYALVAARQSFNMFFNTASTLRTGPQREPGGSLTVYGAASRAERLIDSSDEDIARTFISDLCTVFPEARDVVEEVVIERWEQGIPFATPGRSAHQPNLETTVGRICFAGDYLGERGGMDTAVTSACEAAAAVQSLLTQHHRHPTVAHEGAG